jgi:4-amino-4-deoxy-L-arabinose transferase-like glycosyltransferase
MKNEPVGFGPMLQKKESPVATVIMLAFGFSLIEALFSVPYLSLELALGRTTVEGIVFSFAVACIAILMAWLYHEWFANRLTFLAQSFTAISKGHWLLLCLLAGAVLRIIWVLIFPPVQSSDDATYFGLAQTLIDEGKYYTAGTYSYWPPGYPFFLSLNFVLLGAKPWVPALANLLLLAATLITVYRLASLIADERIARLSTFLLTLWPNYIALAGQASKELLLALLLPLAIVLYLDAVRSSTGTRRLFFAFLSGLTLGYSGLTQPSILLFPAVLASHDIIQRESFRIVVPRFALLIIGMVLIIAPWTIRNYLVLNAFVPVSNTGGISLYIGNNPSANGGYMNVKKQLGGYDEVLANRVAFRLASEWMINNPADFLRLSIKKQILFLGDDSGGVYATLKRGLGIADVRYIIFKGLANFYWMSIIVLLLASLFYHLRSAVIDHSELSLLMLSFLYFFAIHSVFESGSRHHVPVMGCLAVIAALPVLRRRSMPPLRLSST